MAVALVIAAFFLAFHPASAQSAPITLTGTYHLVHEDARLGTETLHFLETPGAVYELRFTGPFQVEPESTIEVSGERQGTDIVVSSVGEIAGPPTVGTNGIRKLLVIAFVWPGRTISTNQATATSFVFGTTDAQRRSLRQWYQDVTYGQLDWTGDVTPTLTTSDPGSCDLYVMANAADAAASAAGYVLSNYNNRMYVFPAIYCGQDRAWGEVGGARSWVSNGLWNIDDGYARMGPDHELAHNLGLYHAHALDCGADTITLACLSGAQGRQCDNANLPPPCYSEYGNSYNVMGNNWTSDPYDAVNWFGFPEEKQVGWFSGRFTSIGDPHIPQTSSYTLIPIEQQTPSTQQGLVINTDSRVYYVEFHAAIGQDGFLTNWPDATSGIIISMRNDIPIGDAGSLALDTAPNSNTSCVYCDFHDEALNVGQAYSDVNGAFSLTLTSVIPGVSAVAQVVWGGATSAPIIASFSPTSGITGSKVTITGTNFTGTTKVTFNGKAAKFKVISPTQLQATVPNGATTGRIAVTNASGSGTSTSDYVVTFSIIGRSPKSGPVGTVVTLTGVGFSGVTSVKFHGVSASFTILSPTSLRATVPAAATTGKVTATSPQGTVAGPKFSVTP